jgi:hypothetical protein
MRSRFAAATSLLLAAGVALADETKPNTLTSKEVVDGWVLLFDGETTFGWSAKKVINEEYWEFAAKDGALVLATKHGGGVFVDYNVHFQSFELSGEYRVFDSIRAAFVIELTTDRPGLRPLLNADFKPMDGWRTFSARVEPQAWTMTVDGKAVENYRVPLKREPNIEYPTALSARLHCYVPERAGGRLELRNLKLRPLGATPLFNGKDLSGWKVFRG